MENPKINDRIAARLQENEFLRQRLLVSNLDYREAVEYLFKLAMSDTSGAKAAAQVLLSAYNGASFHLSVSDLGLLDLPHFEKALVVLRGRCMLFLEPHQVIDNGRTKFEQLHERWHGYHNDNRYKK